MYYKTVATFIFASDFYEIGIINTIFDYVYCRPVQFPVNHFSCIGDYIRIWIDNVGISRTAIIVDIVKNKIIANDSMCDTTRYICKKGLNGFYYIISNTNTSFINSILDYNIPVFD